MAETLTAPQAAPAEDEATALLRSLANDLMKSADAGAERVQVLDGIIARITALDLDTQKALAKLPAFRQLVDVALDAERPAVAGDAPGSIRGFIKKSWTQADLDTMPTKTFTPNRDAQLIWNGLRCDVRADVEVTVPEVFHGVYMDSRIQTRNGHAHMAWLMGHKADILDRTILGPSSYQTRALQEPTGQGTFLPGGGLIPDAVFPASGEGAGGGETAS